MTSSRDRTFDRIASLLASLATSSSSWIARSARTSPSRSASVLSIAYALVLGESCLKHVFREVLQDAGRINHAGVDLLRVHLDGQQAHAGVQRLELVVHLRERRVYRGGRGAA